MTCDVCNLSQERRRLVEKLHQDGSSIEDIGNSFRIDYDVIATHVSQHVKPVDDHTTRTTEVLDELKDMIEAARIEAENTPDPDRKAVYGQLVKLYHGIAMDMKDRQDKELQQAKEAQVVIDALVTTVLNPLLTDTTKVIITELAKLKEVLHKTGVSGSIDTYFAETTRRIGASLTDVAEPYLETVRTCVDGTGKKKRKRT